MNITMLGTGNASAIDCYNSCFIIDDDGELILVDGGGGSTIFKQIKQSGYDWKKIQNIIVTHKHLDHITGIFWLVRMICQHINRNEYSGNINIYSNKEVIYLIEDFIKKFLEERDYNLLAKRIFLIEVNDGQHITINDKDFIFFDIQSKKALQYGFKIQHMDKTLVCCGDEPYNKENERYVKNSDWLIHEAFCLKSEERIFKPYEKNHSTVKDACETAQELNIKNLILYHTVDNNLKNRKKLYSKEGKKYFSGNLIIPDDLEKINI